MKIGFISTIFGYSWGGSEELWYEAAKEALSRGHSVVCSMHEDASGGAKVNELKKRGVPIFVHRKFDRLLIKRLYHRLRLKVTNSEPYFPPETRSPFRQFFAERPDVICITQGDAYGLLLLPDLRHLLGKLGIPFVVISQGAYPYVSLKYEDRLAMRDYFGKASSSVFVSNASRELVERQVAAHIKNATVINNPASMREFGVIPWPEGSTLQMALVARVEVFHKAHDLLFGALASELWRTRDWRLNLYGTGADEEYLKDLAALYRIDDKVIFRGHAQDVREVWAKNHLAVLTSYSEGLPLAIVEAMLSGRPALVTNAGGMPELVTPNINGFIAGCTSAPAIRLALDDVWAKKDDLREYGQRAYETMTEKLDLAPGNTLVNLLEKAASGN